MKRSQEWKYELPNLPILQLEDFHQMEIISLLLTKSGNDLKWPWEGFRVDVSANSLPKS